ncbi:amino acid permease [Methanohalophilus halophilus]|uniref:Amino acid permease n=1 Tax=Methanohalophilus halophilus TaxID=2177 RepID=A0A1L3Q421_9EURY|nr:amino acid permease [Methanohalophilus halophilus]APH39610.1 amino acid transporter [Methanohalophilus halophilus]RNI09054.1 amino acid permease [Methanohalophilus halophilus]SDW32794.1 Amino acid transporter [Methanohalophilus halophilus]
MPEDNIRVSLSRDLTLFDITMIGLAGMIGAGIFALTGIATGIAGPAVMLAFLLNGVVATFTGLAYAELGSAMPEAGGSYLWVREGMGNHLGFLSGWVDWAAHTIACALYAVTFGAFFSELIVNFLGYEQFDQGLLIKLSALVIVSLMALINFMGAKESGRLGGFVTLFKIAILVVFAGFGIYKTITQPDWTFSFFSDPSFAPNGFIGILVAMGLTFIAFEGYEIIVQSGEEVKRPEHNIPKAVLISLWTAVIIYIIVAFALIGGIEVGIPNWIYLGELGEFSMIRVANQIVSFGSVLILVGGFVSTISAMNATVYSSSRVAFALGRMGFLPNSLSNINEKRRTPHFAILFSYLIIASMALLPIETVASAANVMFLILFILVNMVLIILRFRRPDLKRAFKMPFAPYLPLVAIVVQVFIGYYMVTEIENTAFVVAVTILWVILGSFIYFSYSEKELKKRALVSRKKMYERKPAREEGYKILIPVKDEESAFKLASFAHSVAKEKDGTILFLSVITLPEQTPFSAADEYLPEKQEFIHRLIDSVDVPAGGIIKVSRSAPDTIMDTVEEEESNMLVMGWRGRTFRQDVVLGSTIDPLLLKAPCDVVVARFEADREWEDMKNILLPTAGGPHAILAAEMARSLARKENGTVTMLNVGPSDEDRKVATKVFQGVSIHLSGVKTESKFIVGDDAVSVIDEEAKNHDVIFLGATTRPFLKNFLSGVFPEQVIRGTDKTVIMTRRWVKFRDMLKKKV